MDTSSVDLLALIGRDTQVKKVASTRGGEYHGPCPFCGGADRFIVQPNSSGGGRWSCRQCNPHWNDAIAYVQSRNNVGFSEACEQLGLNSGYLSRPMRRPLSAPPNTQTVAHFGSLNGTKNWVALGDNAWQISAARFASRTFHELWSARGRNAREYLRWRGLTDEVIREAALGYNARDTYELWSPSLANPVWLPSGIVIPWMVDDLYWRMNIRQLSNRTPKYIQPKGCANGLYRTNALYVGCTVIVTEGEFDALAIAANIRSAELRARLVPVATGSATGSRLSRWITDISLAECVLLAFDSDKAGEDAASWWSHILPDGKAIRLHPSQHDVTDMVKMGEDLDAWVLSAVR